MSAQEQPKFEISTSRLLPAWLNQENCSIAFSTYQVGKMFMMGLQPDQRVHFTERTFPRCMGLGVTEDAQTVWMSSLFQLWRFENSLPKDGLYQSNDKVYLPQMAYTTGDLDIHDIAIGQDGKPIFVNTLFGCLATVSETHSFKPLWKPPFLSKLVPEDRCHMNGMAEVNGKPKYVTIVGMTDVADGWRDHRKNGGVVMDVETNEVVCSGLSMPHSPRVYQGKLWLLEAGTGYFGYVDLEKGSFERVTFVPGFLRGMDFTGNYAVVGSSGLRENKTFQGLALDENLKKANTEARSALSIINLTTGAVENWMRTSGIIQELYDVRILHNTRQPLLIGTRADSIRTMLSIEE